MLSRHHFVKQAAQPRLGGRTLCDLEKHKPRIGQVAIGAAQNSLKIS
jgi:hypothetical protein